MCIFAPHTLRDVASLVWRVLRGGFSADERLIYFQASEITVDADPPAVTEIDGELLGQTPLVARAVRGGVTVLVPQPRGEVNVRALMRECGSAGVRECGSDQPVCNS